LYCLIRRVLNSLTSHVDYINIIMSYCQGSF
jgi:hypothetical protein